MPRFRLCQHTKNNGELCGSPAMRRKNYCYFHLEVVRRRRRLAVMERNRMLLELAKYYEERIFGLNSYALNILSHYSPANSQPSRICKEKGEGVSSSKLQVVPDAASTSASFLWIGHDEPVRSVAEE